MPSGWSTALPSLINLLLAKPPLGWSTAITSLTTLLFAKIPSDCSTAYQSHTPLLLAGSLLVAPMILLSAPVPFLGVIGFLNWARVGLGVLGIRVWGQSLTIHLFASIPQLYAQNTGKFHEDNF